MRNLIVFLVFSVSFFVDIYIDIKEGVPVGHLVHELILLILALGAMAYQLRIIVNKNQQILSLNSELLQTKKDYQSWKEKSHTNSHEIRQMIDQQFGQWHLSHSEKDVALLLIKGFSMKEIADFRSTHEKTVRQQATTIYKKSGLSGRQELAAFFLEDILTLPTA